MLNKLKVAQQKIKKTKIRLNSVLIDKAFDDNEIKLK